MSASYKKSVGWAVVLVLFGLLALIGGDMSLLILVPAALLVWYSARPLLGIGRN